MREDLRGESSAVYQLPSGKGRPVNEEKREKLRRIMREIKERREDRADKCDKCKETVEPFDDARQVMINAGYDKPAVMLFGGPRHLRCSPSRAQYVVHPCFDPVVDDRPDFDKRLLDPDDVRVREARITKGWMELQAQAFNQG